MGQITHIIAGANSAPNYTSLRAVLANYVRPRMAGAIPEWAGHTVNWFDARQYDGLIYFTLNGEKYSVSKTSQYGFYIGKTTDVMCGAILHKVSDGSTWYLGSTPVGGTDGGWHFTNEFPGEMVLSHATNVTKGSTQVTGRWEWPYAKGITKEFVGKNGKKITGVIKSTVAPTVSTFDAMKAFIKEITDSWRPVGKWPVGTVWHNVTELPYLKFIINGESYTVRRHASTGLLIESVANSLTAMELTKDSEVAGNVHYCAAVQSATSPDAGWKFARKFPGKIVIGPSAVDGTNAIEVKTIEYPKPKTLTLQGGN